MNFYRLDPQSAFLVSQKALIFEAGKLLVLEAMPDKLTGKSRWELPGGLLDMDESLAEGLLREVSEETGLMVSIGKLVAVWDHREPNFQVQDGRVLDVRILGMAFECRRLSGEVRLSDEHRQFRWIDRSETAQLDFAQNSKFAVERSWAG